MSLINSLPVTLEISFSKIDFSILPSPKKLSFGNELTLYHTILTFNNPETESF